MTHPLFQRSSGVLLPLASVPAPGGIGDMGPAARHFVEWLEAAGQRWWQMLPVHPLGRGNSPYDSSSAFAGEAAYLSIDDLVRDGILPAACLRGAPKPAEGRVSPRKAWSWKKPLLLRAFRTWTKQGGAQSKAFERFCAEQSVWLGAWEVYENAEPGLSAFLQFQFERQWQSLREHARAHGIALLGDVPLFVGADSADVQAHPKLFRLNRRGKPTVISGCPPDAFSSDGQLWGHPHYDWKAHRAEGFRWWRERVARELQLFDALRLDHFIGIQRAWEVKANHKTARHGQWVKGPGAALLGALADGGQALPLVAEDLGAITPAVRALRDQFDLPGMRVLQWGFDPGSEHAPESVPENSLVYCGTHDNDTSAGWFRGLDKQHKARVLSRTGGSAASLPWDLWQCASSTAAHTAIVQLQDLLSLGRVARTNTPGTSRGNWCWRPDPAVLSKDLAVRTRALATSTARFMGHGVRD
ncbi:MAG: 4-alpha-glucanotransferase [Planctomycetota bacterium]|jgi:4-alpha-glucanotransferase